MIPMVYTRSVLLKIAFLNAVSPLSMYGMDIEHIQDNQGKLPQSFGFLQVCHGSKNIQNKQQPFKVKCIDHNSSLMQKRAYGFSDFMAADYGANGPSLVVDLALSAGIGAVTGMIIGLSLLDKKNNSSSITNSAVDFKNTCWEYLPLTQKMNRLKDDYPRFKKDPPLMSLRARKNNLMFIGIHLVERQKLVKPIAKKIREQEARDLTLLLCLKNSTLSCLKNSRSPNKLPTPLIQKIMNMQYWNDDSINDYNLLVEQGKDAPSFMDAQFKVDLVADEDQYKVLSGYSHESLVPLQRARLKNDIFKINAMSEFRKLFRENHAERQQRKIHLKKIVDYYSSSYIRFLPTVIAQCCTWIIPIIVICWGTKKMITKESTENAV